MKKSKNEIIKLAVKFFAILLIMALAILNYERLKNIDVRALVASTSSAVSAYLIVLFIYLIKGVLFIIPASLVYISVGMAFPVHIAIILNLLGIAVEVSASYIIGRFLGGDYVLNLLRKSKKGEKLIALKDKYNKSSIFTVRLFPVFPIDFASLFFGSLKYPFAKYLLISVAAIAPRVILFTALGDTAYDYIPMSLIIKLIIAAVAVAAVVIIIKWIASLRKNT